MIAFQRGYCKEGFCNTINVQCRFAWGNAGLTDTRECDYIFTVY